MGSVASLRCPCLSLASLWTSSLLDAESPPPVGLDTNISADLGCLRFSPRLLDGILRRLGPFCYEEAFLYIGFYYLFLYLVSLNFIVRETLRNILLIFKCIVTDVVVLLSVLKNDAMTRPC